MIISKRRETSLIVTVSLCLSVLCHTNIRAESTEINPFLKFDQRYLDVDALQTQEQVSISPEAFDSQNHLLSGLYFRADYIDSLDSRFIDSRYAIEMDFLEQGYAEHKKRAEKKDLDIKLQLLQSARNDEEARLQEKLAEIRKVRNLVYRVAARMKHQKLVTLISLQEQRLQEGSITQDVILETKLKLQQAENEKRYYDEISSQSLPTPLYSLANQIEKISLRDLHTLQTAARSSSIDLRIIELMKQRADFYPEFKDDVRLRAFIESRKNTALFEDRETVLGLRVRVPLSFSDDRDDKIAYELSQYEKQGQIVSVRLNQKVESLINQVLFETKNIVNAQIEMSFINDKLKLAEKQSNANLDGLKWTPESQKALLELKSIDVYKTGLLARLDTLLLVTQLQYLTGSEQSQDLFTSNSVLQE